MSLEEDKALMGRIAGGDRSAFRLLYERYEGPVFQFVRRRIEDAHEAADLFHEVMMEVWRGAHRYEGRARLSSWIFGVAHNKTLSALRARGRREWDALDEETPDADAPTQFEQVAAASDAKVLRECLGRMDPAKRETIALVFVSGLKYREVAETLAIAEGSVKARVHRALRLLKECVTSRGVAPALGDGA